MVKNLPAMLETWVQSLGQEYSPREGNGNPLQQFLPGELHGQRSLAGYSPWDHKELDTTEWLTHTHTRFASKSDDFASNSDDFAILQAMFLL